MQSSIAQYTRGMFVYMPCTHSFLLSALPFIGAVTPYSSIRRVVEHNWQELVLGTMLERVLLHLMRLL